MTLATVPRTLGDNLAWVRGALDEHLAQVRNHIQLHVQDGGREHSLRPALQQMQQLSGVLNMIQCYGPLLLVEEMVRALGDLIEGGVQEREIVLEVLLGATLQLADYFDLLRAGKADGALVFHPVINELRVAAGQTVLSERALFVEYLRRSVPDGGEVALPDRPGIDRAAAAKLSGAFQTALLGWLRDSKPDCLQRLIKIARYSQESARNPRLELSWRALLVILGALRGDSLKPTLELKRLLGQMGQCLARLADHDEMDPALDLEDFPFSLLYYVGRSDPASEDARRLGEEYGLKSILPDDRTLEYLRDSLRGPNTELLNRLSEALKEDLSTIKDALDLMERAQDADYSGLDEILEICRRTADTLNMLGLTAFNRAMQQQIRRLHEVERTGVPSTGTWMEVATALLQLEQGLDDALFRQLLMRDLNTEEGEREEEPQHNADFKGGLTALLQEASVNIARLQEFVRTYLNDGEAVLLTEASRLLEEIQAGLNIIGYAEPAEVAGDLRKFLSAGAPSLRQDRQLADSLADAVAAFEFYLQAQKAGRAQAPHLLEQVRGAVDKLNADRPEGNAEADTAETYTHTPEAIQPEEAVSPEIREVFLEEGQEVLKDLQERVPRWLSDPAVNDDLSAIRRAFHTLKGSGRMVGAEEIGEFAWAVENLLNRCLEGAIGLNDDITGMVNEALGILPRVLEKFSVGEGDVADTVRLTERAHALSQVRTAGGESASADETKSSPPVEPEEAAAPESEPEESPEDRDLRRVFWSDAYRRVAVFSSFLEDYDGTESGLPAVLRALHVLRGSAETAGMADIARLAGALEGLVESVRNLRRPIEGEVRALLTEADRALHDALESLKAPASGQSGMQQDLVSRIRAQQVRLTREVARYGVGVEVMEGFTDEAIGHLEKVEAGLNAWLDHSGEYALDDVRAALSAVADSARTAQAWAMHEAVIALDEWVARVAAGGSGPWEAAREGLGSLLDQMYVMLDRYRDGESGFDIDALRIRLQALTPPAPAEASPPVTDEEQEWTEPPATEQPEDAEAAPDVDFDLLDIFSGEATELLDAITHQVGRWREGVSTALPELRRALHTLKGGARMAGAHALAEISHELETLLESDAIAEQSPDEAVLGQIDRDMERMYEMLDALMRQGASAGAPVGLSEEGAPEADRERPPHDEDPAGESASYGGDPEPPADSPGDETSAALNWSRELFESEPAAATGERVSFGDNARVGVAQLRSMLDDAGEISIFRSRLEQQGNVLQFQLNEMQRTIQRTRDQLRKLELETEATILARHRGDPDDDAADRYSEEFDPLEMDRYSRIQELSRSLTESVTDLNSLHGLMHQAAGENESLLLQQGRVNASLQEGLMSTLLVPFARQVPRLKRLVARSCEEAGKQAELAFSGTQAEMDRSVLERMTPPLEHILRNAVIHGLESPRARAVAGKPDQGTLQVVLRREAAQLLIEISDDGQGLDLTAIRERARATGLLRQGEELGDDALARLILEPGFSTADSVSQEAGRGVGMDVVNTSIRQLGGTLDVQTRRGGGTRFVIRLPLSLAITKTLLARVGEELYALPLTGIAGITRVPSKTLGGYFQGADATVKYGGLEYKLRYFGDLVEIGRPVAEELPKFMPVLAINAGDQRVALVPDALLGSQEFVVKSVGPHVSTVPGVSGATVMADGNVVLILDPAALLHAESHRSFVQGPPKEATPSVREEAGQHPLVLVVDDSITIRRVSERLLVRNGFRVATARDGMDALAKLQTEIPDLVLLDIEMPRIDGFEVATYMRNNPELRPVPIIMITSRSGEKHRARARDIGVNRYLTKPYKEEALLSEIHAMLPGAGKGAVS